MRYLAELTRTIRHVGCGVLEDRIHASRNRRAADGRAYVPGRTQERAHRRRRAAAISSARSALARRRRCCGRASWDIAAGGMVTAYAVPAALSPFYGTHAVVVPVLPARAAAVQASHGRHDDDAAEHVAAAREPPPTGAAASPASASRNAFCSAVGVPPVSSISTASSPGSSCSVICRRWWRRCAALDGHGDRIARLARRDRLTATAASRSTACHPPR